MKRTLKIAAIFVCILTYSFITGNCIFFVIPFVGETHMIVLAN
jgi:hypothetical protein